MLAQVQQLPSQGGHKRLGAFLGWALWTGFQDSTIYKNKVFVSLVLFLIFVLRTVTTTNIYLWENEW